MSSSFLTFFIEMKMLEEENENNERAQTGRLPLNTDN